MIEISTDRVPSERYGVFMLKMGKVEFVLATWNRSAFICLTYKLTLSACKSFT